MAEDTWSMREGLWLEEIDRANREGRDWVPAEVSHSEEAVWRPAVTDWDTLIAAGYVAVRTDSRNAQGKPYAITGARLTARGRRAIGRWPDPAAHAIDELLATLEALIAVAGPDERSRLVKARDEVAAVGRSVLVALAIEAATAATGGL